MTGRKIVDREKNRGYDLDMEIKKASQLTAGNIVSIVDSNKIKDGEYEVKTVQTGMFADGRIEVVFTSGDKIKVKPYATFVVDA